ncbi:MAG: hypothetical protein LBS45_08175 [Synergistaceae bacterium]|jgi:hypothetical protein|nr:hypothetical protein [Synergistaceae bacterium]
MADRDKRAHVFHATPEHALALSDNLYPEDARDLERGWGCKPDEVVLDAFRHSGGSCYAIVTDDSSVAGIFGSTIDGNIWMMTGKAFDKRVAFQFIRESGPWVEQLIKKHGRLYGHINANNLKMIRWLESSGFEIEDLENGYVRFEKCARR